MYIVVLCVSVPLKELWINALTFVGNPILRCQYMVGIRVQS